jgi:hypothetical protein
MVQRVEEFSAKLKCTFLSRPVDRNTFRKRKVHVVLSGTVDVWCSLSSVQVISGVSSVTERR